MHSVDCKMLNLLGLFCIVGFAWCFASCSIPSLEKPQCTAGRDVVKRFYSFHFGNDMASSPENLKAREQYLTSDLFNALSDSGLVKKDYFTSSEKYPKAFRVGECSVDSDNNATLQVILLWRNDDRSEQKEVFVETVQTGDKWLINKVSH